MQAPYQVADDTFVIPSTLTIPGLGLLYLNPMVIKSREPVLVDTGAPVFREQYLQARLPTVGNELVIERHKHRAAPLAFECPYTTL